ncbi:Clusterin-associated protein 1 -like protein [Trichinella murrelli]|uniref:Clusterin-associated protein 1-like protein n=1 Tax=Trichinella murrelli TaxID=144512 RepID=A0A0V0TVV0_9BILA|nr:Clusterin-associated protein 1 -like protein [Trichinella murrelli]
MRALNYPKFISIESFYKPNFLLVADALRWICKRYCDEQEVKFELETEQDRVIFIKSAVIFIYQQTGLKLNPKKLYQADVEAIDELLKAVEPLYKAKKLNNISEGKRDDDQQQQNIQFKQIRTTLEQKLSDLGQYHTMVNDITDNAARLYDLLSQETENKVSQQQQQQAEQRTVALARQVDIDEVENHVKHALSLLQQELKQTLKDMENIEKDELAVTSKIEKKKSELDRLQTRLAQLQTVRPAYMDEYETAEEELRRIYSQYVLKYRNLHYCKQLLERDKRQQSKSLSLMEDEFEEVEEQQEQTVTPKAATKIDADLLRLEKGTYYYTAMLLLFTKIYMSCKLQTNIPCRRQAEHVWFYSSRYIENSVNTNDSDDDLILTEANPNAEDNNRQKTRRLRVIGDK